VDHFARVCRVVNGMKRLTVGAIGARTTAFKTVRIDELALQKVGITMEALDLSMVIERTRKMAASGAAYRAGGRRARPPAGRACPKTPSRIWSSWMLCSTR
jgi:L-fucose isomerase-like protein